MFRLRRDDFMKTKYGILAFALIMFASAISPALAQSSEEDRKIAGVTPDSLLYGFDTAFDGISLFFTFDDELKARKNIEIARERLFEAKVMIDDSRLEAAEKARNEHERALSNAASSVGRLRRGDSLQEIRDIIEIEDELRNHEESINDVSSNIKLKIKGSLTEDQQSIVNTILESLKGNSEELKIEIKSKENSIKIRIRQETGKSEDEVEDEIRKFKREGLEVKAELSGSQAFVKIENKFSLNSADKNEIINEIIKRFALDRETADRLLRTETTTEAEDRERLEIKAETKEGVTRIDVERRFTLSTTDRNAILIEIVSRTRLIREDIENALEQNGNKNKEIEIKAEAFGGSTQVNVKLEFTPSGSDRNSVVQQVLDKFKLGREDIDNILKIENDNFEAKMSGAEGVPPVSTSARGKADFELEDNELKFKLLVSGIEDATFAHIHLAAKGQNGPPAAFLLSSRATGDINIEGTIKSQDLVGPMAGKTLADLMAAMREGNTYVNVHSSTFPDGEIRGQIKPDTDESRERLKVEIKDGMARAEFRFFVNTVQRNEIVEGTFQKLSTLSLNNILDSLEGVVCIQVITSAISPSGICREFPTPCDVPEGWKMASRCEDNEGKKTVEIMPTGFNPNNLEINRGDTVVFVNKDTAAHWPASAAHPSHAVYPESGGCIGSKFDACKGLLTGETFEFTFNFNGTWQYHDHVNFGAPFFGTVVVK